MQQIDPNFDERNAGFSRFSKFVMEAGQKGLVQVTKLENGQFEVAPVRGREAAPARDATRAPTGRPPREGREAREAREPREPRTSEARPAEPRSGDAARPAEGREEGRGRNRGRGRGRGRGDRDRGAGDGAAPAAAATETRPEGALTLARAFQLMAQSLSELGGAVGHEQLRARMVALHGRDDALLDPTRFARLLRQANDAVVADVRKVGDDEYEIALHRRGGGAQKSAAPAAAAPAAPAVDGAAPVTEAAAPAASAGPATDAGQRQGLRFRRGSRGPMRAGDVPLVGVVRVDAPAEPVMGVEAPKGAPGSAAASAEESAAAPAPKGRGRRAPKADPAAAPVTRQAKTPRARAAKAAAPADAGGPAAKPPKKRSSPRAAKAKAE